MYRNCHRYLSFVMSLPEIQAVKPPSETMADLGDEQPAGPGSLRLVGQ